MLCPLCNSQANIIIKKNDFVVRRCRKCSLQYIDNSKYDISQYSNYYQKIRKPNYVLNKLREKQYNLDVKFLLQFVKKGRVLDVGCSDGKFLSKFIKKRDFHLCGIDPDESAIKKAKQNYKKDIEFFSSDLIDYKTKQKFDCIVFRGSFQYLGIKLKPTIQNMLKICSKNGKIIIFVLPNSDSFLYSLLQDKWHLFNHIEHTLIFNRQSILKLCQIFDLKLLHLSYPYLETVYANPEKDNKSLIELIKNNRIKSFPFWGNVMQVVLEK